MSTPLNSKSAPGSSHSAESKFQLLLFRLGDSSGGGQSELFGINVFKVREIVVGPEITRIVNAPEHALGLANVRGQLIPVIDLPTLSGCTPKTNSKIVLVTEFARTTQAFLVDEVVEIIQIEWKHLLAADNNSSGLLSGVARIDGDAADSRLAQVLDVEQIIRNVFPDSQPDPAHNKVEKIKLPEGTSILFADDSAIARMLVEENLKMMGVPYVAVKNGKEAWSRLEQIHSDAVTHGQHAKDRVALVLTDLEMPEMDGFTLTRSIKNDNRFAGIPVIVYSSLTGSASQGHASGVGADAYVAKFEPHELANAISTTLTRG
nr:chemotaxis protein [uncultured Rhodoferax sp.]